MKLDDLILTFGINTEIKISVGDCLLYEGKIADLKWGMGFLRKIKVKKAHICADASMIIEAKI